MAHTALDSRFHDLIDVNAPVNRLGTGFHLYRRTGVAPG